MRRWFSGALLALMAAATAFPATPAAAVEAMRAARADPVHRFVHGGLMRRYLVHLPASYRPGRAMPVVMALHGGGGDMTIMATDAYYGLISKSEAAGFVAVFPNGSSRLPSGKLATWNAGLCCGSARDRGIDDVGFLKTVVRHLGARYSIDRRRVFAVGMSNGGMMAYRLACEAAEVFSGIMAVAGTDNTATCPQGPAVPVLHVHALDDDHVLFEGGMGPGVIDPDAVNDFTSVPDTIARWVRRDRAFGATRRVVDVEGATCDRHPARPGGAPVQLCVTETGGHSWPGGTKPRGGTEPSQAIRAPDVMWDFFSGR